MAEQADRPETQDADLGEVGVGEGGPPDRDSEREWWRFRAQLAGLLWGALAKSGATVEEAAKASGLPLERVNMILTADHGRPGERVSTFDLFSVFHALGFRLLPELQDKHPHG